MDMRIALSDGRHPIWVIVRPVVLMAALAVFLNFTASHFDAGEVKSIAGVGVSSVILDLIKRSFTTI
jgi:hypothetical protein